ncbi:hypothetical protein WUBG_19120, partial [Wuchereria bancrofti]
TDRQTQTHTHAYVDTYTNIHTYTCAHRHYKQAHAYIYVCIFTCNTYMCTRSSRTVIYTYGWIELKEKLKLINYQ